MIKRSVFTHRGVGYMMLAPQLLILGLFFYWPSVQAISQSLTIADPWSGASEFVWFDNFRRLFSKPDYWRSVEVTFIFVLGVTAFAIGAGVILAVFADRVLRTRALYNNLLIWPYAVAPVVAGAFWLFLLEPTIGIIPQMLFKPIGFDWRPQINGTHAMILVIIGAGWKGIAYNFVFFLAALQSMPKSLIEAAALDGAGPFRRFVDILFPLTTPTVFFLLVVNLANALFDSFSLIHAITHGGPAGATTVLVYKVYRDGFEGLDLGLSAAESVVLMVLVIALTAVQFQVLERRVQYAR